MSAFRRLIMQEARRRYEAMLEGGVVASLSPTPLAFISSTIDLLSLNQSSLVMELGCGDGRWLKAIHSRFHSLCIGVEMDNERLKSAMCSGIQVCELVLGDMFTVSFTAATHIIFYLSVEGNKRVYEKVKRECHVGTGTILLAVGFHVPELDPPTEVFVSCGLKAYKYIL